MTNDKDSAVLAPCPFCGSDPTLEERGDGDLFVFLCQSHSSCYGSGLATFGMRSKRDEAITAWNTRQPAQSNALVAALEGWRTIYQLAPPHPDIAPDIWQDMIDRTAAALEQGQ